MINREMIPAVLLTYDDSLDEYGQPRMTVPSKSDIEITEPKIYKHSPVEDIRFNEISIGDDTYRICVVNPQGRLNQLFLKRI